MRTQKNAVRKGPAALVSLFLVFVCAGCKQPAVTPLVPPVQKFTVTFNKTPEHGTLTASLDGKDFTGGEVEKGKIIIFTAEPEPPYRVRKWTGLENAGSKTVVTLTVTKTADVSVEFVKVPEHTITFTQPEHGKLIALLEGKNFISGDKVPEGKPIIFIARPDAGYRLLTWKNIDTDPEHGYTKAYIVRGEKTVSVTFEPDENLTIRGPENNRYVESCKRTAEGRIEIPPDVKRIYGGAFRDCVKVTEVVLPDGITQIRSDTFKGCTGLTSVAMPSVTQIEDSAFFGCTGLTSVTMPSVTQIGDSAFFRCTGLTSVTMPSVTQIGKSAFGGCTELTNIAIDNSNPFFCAEGSIIYNKDKTELICGAGNLTQLTIPETVTQIGERAFGGCTGLTSVTMPSVTQIGERAFSGCTGLTSVAMPSVTQIGTAAFSDCTGLTSVTMPSVTQIGTTAFYGCTGLTSVTMPSVTQIGTAAFYGCTGLKDITIESMNLTEIGTRAFYNIHTDAKFKVKAGGNVKEKLKAIDIAEDKIIEQ